MRTYLSVLVIIAVVVFIAVMSSSGIREFIKGHIARGKYVPEDKEVKVEFIYPKNGQTFVFYYDPQKDAYIIDVVIRANKDSITQLPFEVSVPVVGHDIKRIAVDNQSNLPYVYSVRLYFSEEEIEKAEGKYIYIGNIFGRVKIGGVLDVFMPQTFYSGTECLGSNPQLYLRIVKLSNGLFVVDYSYAEGETVSGVVVGIYSYDGSPLDFSGNLTITIDGITIRGNDLDGSIFGAFLTVPINVSKPLNVTVEVEETAGVQKVTTQTVKPESVSVSCPTGTCYAPIFELDIGLIYENGKYYIKTPKVEFSLKNLRPDVPAMVTDTTGEFDANYSINILVTEIDGNPSNVNLGSTISQLSEDLSDGPEIIFNKNGKYPDTVKFSFSMLPLNLSVGEHTIKMVFEVNGYIYNANTSSFTDEPYTVRVSLPTINVVVPPVPEKEYEVVGNYYVIRTVAPFGNFSIDSIEFFLQPLETSNVTGNDAHPVFNMTYLKGADLDGDGNQDLVITLGDDTLIFNQGLITDTVVNQGDIIEIKIESDVVDKRVWGYGIYKAKIKLAGANIYEQTYLFADSGVFLPLYFTYSNPYPDAINRQEIFPESVSTTVIGDVISYTVYVALNPELKASLDGCWNTENVGIRITYYEDGLGEAPIPFQVTSYDGETATIDILFPIIKPSDSERTIGYLYYWGTCLS